MEHVLPHNDYPCQCGSQYIVNKKYNLCDECNYKRLHGGKSKQQVYEETDRPVRKLYVLKRSTKPIRQQTKKESAVKQKLSAVKHNIEMTAVQEGNYFCWGCGRSYIGLDKSHILSVGQFKYLECDPENINLFCRECHVNWESGDIALRLDLNSFEKDLDYILLREKQVFDQILGEIEQFLTLEIADSQRFKKGSLLLNKFGGKVC